MSLIADLETYLYRNKKEWHSKAQLTSMVWKDKRGVRYSPENVGRRLRDLEQQSIIAVTYEGVNAKYRWIPKDWRSRYVPIDKRLPYSAAAWRPAETRTLSLL